MVNSLVTISLQLMLFVFLAQSNILVRDCQADASPLFAIS